MTIGQRITGEKKCTMLQLQQVEYKYLKPEYCELKMQIVAEQDPARIVSLTIRQQFEQTSRPKTIFTRAKRMK